MKSSASFLRTARAIVTFVGLGTVSCRDYEKYSSIRKADASSPSNAATGGVQSGVGGAESGGTTSTSGGRVPVDGAGADARARHDDSGSDAQSPVGSAGDSGRGDAGSNALDATGSGGAVAGNACPDVAPLCGIGDGCCPASCDRTSDPDCGSGTGCTNIAPNAVASHSGGGVSQLGPEKMNDGMGKSACSGTWVFNDWHSAGAWIQLTWNDVVTIASIYVETESASAQSSCGFDNRNLAGGTLQYLSGGIWHDVTSFNGFTDDVHIDLTFPISTTAIRIFDMSTTEPAYNSVIYEFHAYLQRGCWPPP